MIAVIADDFTGAAEIGGIGLRHGLNVVIETETISNTNADLLIFATDTRSLPESEALMVTEKITREIIDLNPEFIFKKIDSALRGHIGSETIAQMKVLQKKRALIIAANPVFKRTIHNGIYSINNETLDKTSFSTDPEFPALTPFVNELIGKNRHEICTGLSPWDTIPDTGLIAGDVKDFGDLEAWACRIDNNTLVAGASGFFNAILSKKNWDFKPKQHKNKPFGEKALYILGSFFPKNDNFIDTINKYGYTISAMPIDLYMNKQFPESWIDFWVNDISNAFKTSKKVFLTIPYNYNCNTEIAFRLKEIMGIVTKRVFENFQPNELIIEGGGTTSVILKHLNIKQLKPFYEIETGVIRMNMDTLDDVILTTKPGSYLWPDSIWLSPEMNYIN